MQENYLTKWLGEKADEHISSQSTESEYYSIKGMKFRVSDHISNRVDHDVDIIFMSPRKYIIIPTNARYKQPSFCHTWREGIDFIEGWMRFVYPYLSNPIRKSNIADCLEENDQHSSIEQHILEQTEQSEPVRTALSASVDDNTADETKHEFIFGHSVNAMLGQDVVSLDNDKEINIMKNIEMFLDTTWFSDDRPEENEKMLKSLSALVPFFKGKESNIKAFCRYANHVAGQTLNEKYEWLDRLVSACSSKKTKNGNYMDLLNGTMLRNLFKTVGASWIPSTKPELLDDIMKTADRILMTQNIGVTELSKKMLKCGGMKSEQKLIWLRAQVH